MNSALRPYAAAGVALLGAGLIAATAVTAPLPLTDVHLPGIQLTAGGDATDIVIDFVRHAQTSPDGSVIAGASNGLPGFPLSDLGQQQAAETADFLHKELGDQVAGIFGGYEQRMAETAAPFVAFEHMAMQPLYGFNEISGGICTDAVPSSPCNVISELTLAAWAFGFRLVPATGSNAYNGEVFEEQVNNAVNTIYNDAMADPDPVVSANGQITDVVFSGGATITAWPLMNVNNPDVAVFLPLLFETLSAGNENGFLANAGVTEVKGNPEDGWTLVSFDGHPMPEYPGLLSELIVDLRDLITAPQTAAYNLFEAALTGVSTTIGGAPVEVHFTTVGDALEAGAKSVGTAIAQFPGAVIDDVVDAVQRLGADVAAGETFSDAFGSVIIGLAP